MSVSAVGIGNKNFSKSICSNFITKLLKKSHLHTNIKANCSVRTVGVRTSRNITEGEIGENADRFKL